jgi:hypothetical protein
VTLTHFIIITRFHESCVVAVSAVRYSFPKHHGIQIACCNHDAPDLYWTRDQFEPRSVYYLSAVRFFIDSPVPLNITES